MKEARVRAEEEKAAALESLRRELESQVEEVSQISGILIQANPCP